MAVITGWACAMKDETIAEVWRTRDSLALKYGHNLDAIMAAMRQRERQPLTPVRKRRTPDKLAAPDR